MPYFQDRAGHLHFLSAADIASGGESLLAAGCEPITDAAGHSIETAGPTGEQRAAIVRAKRDVLLAIADRAYSTAVDAGVLNLSEISAFRKALRDVPEQSGFPDEIHWPVLSDDLIVAKRDKEVIKSFFESP